VLEVSYDLPGYLATGVSGEITITFAPKVSQHHTSMRVSITLIVSLHTLKGRRALGSSRRAQQHHRILSQQHQA
jgi:hypothetical protein